MGEGRDHVERANEVLDAVIAFVETASGATRSTLRPAIAALGLKPGKVMHVALHRDRGHEPGLPLFDSIALLGRDVGACTGCGRRARGSPAS